MYYVCVLKIGNGGGIYVGYTNDLKRRLREHKNKRPKLVYYEAYFNEQDAREREFKLKQRGQTVRRLKKNKSKSEKIDYVLGAHLLLFT